jgi:thiopurine S-methyltransferase
LTEDWLDRWAEGRTGWHEPDGNAALRAHWPVQRNPGSVLVPLCGKSPDLMWLAKRGHRVIGVELSPIAIEGFFADHDLGYTLDSGGSLPRYAATDETIELFCGDYFEFQSPPIDALYDRGALVALAPERRPAYVAHTRGLLAAGSLRLIVTLEYDQNIVNGPPFAIDAAELSRYWDDLERVGDRDDSDNCPPKFRQAGLRDIREVCWRSR